MAWVGKVLSKLASTHGLTLSAMVVGHDTQPQDRGLGDRLYDWVDSRIFQIESDGLSRQPIPAAVARAAVVQPGALIGDGKTRLGPEAVDHLTTAGVDLLLALDVPPVQTDGGWKFAVWTVELAGAPLRSDDLTVFYPLMRGRRSVVVTLREAPTANRFLPEGLRRSVTSVLPLSLRTTANRTVWAAADLVISTLDQVVAGHVTVSEQTRSIARHDLDTPSRPPRRAALFGVGQLIRVGAHSALRAVTRDEWSVFIRHREPGLPAREPAWTEIRAPAGHSYADPFLMHDGEREWLFVEDYVYSNSRARIVCLEVRDMAMVGSPFVVLDRPYHLSYPYVFRHQGETYLIPESGAEERVDLYRAQSLPDRWEHVATMLSGMRAADTTLLEHDGLWWLWTTLANTGRSPSDDLHLFWSNDLAGPWQPHPLNPVVTDVRTGRCAGRPFLYEGAIVRPAQDSEKRYGHAVNFQAVRTIAVDKYEETTIGRLDAPSGRSMACHTYNFDSDYEVTDFLVRRHRWLGRYR